MREPLAIVWCVAARGGRHRPTVTVSRDSGRGAGSVHALRRPRVEALPPRPYPVVGIDAGITSLLTLSTGEKIANPRHERRERAALAVLSGNWPARRRARQPGAGAGEGARVHAQDQPTARRDHLHQLTTRLVRETQAIVIEDLHVHAWSRTAAWPRDLGRGVVRAARAVGVQCAWYGRNLVVIGPVPPVSKTCSALRARGACHCR